MSTVVFWIMFWLLVAVLVISTAVREREKKNRRRDKIRESFGSTGETVSGDPFSDSEPSLLLYMKETDPDDQCLDEITASDLSLRDLYKRLNRCVTSAGDAVLYCLFRSLSSDIQKSESRYEKIRSFIDDKDRAVLILNILDSYGKRSDDDEFELIRGLREASSGSIIFDILAFVLLIGAVICTAFYPVIGLAATVLMIIVCISGYFSGKRRMDANLKGLAFSLKLIRCAKSLCENGYDDLKEYTALFPLLYGNRLISYRDATSSDPLSIVFDYVRMITHIDLIVYNIKIGKIKERSEELARLYIDIGMLDALLSMASYLSQRQHCGAKFSQEAVLKTEGIYHPLVKDPVCNDLYADRGVLITGSNASGKSTFLKAVGVNEIFARSFGFAFAESFETGMFWLYTSMALSDDLLSGESYYVVEARSIKRICDAAKTHRCLCIIDEILRGTNTTERIAASSEVLRYLCKSPVLCFAATHDKELTTLLGDDMDMYHFTEEISGDTVTFPFVIQKGVSDKTNAIRILSMLGFDAKVVSSAKALVKGYKTSGRWGS